MKILFTNTGLRSTLECKDYQSVDMMSSIVAEFINFVMRFVLDASLTEAYTRYSEHILTVVND